LPRDRVKGLRAVQASGGAFVTVTDEQIIRAIPDMARLSGVFAEPASAAAFAGLRAALTSGIVDPAMRVVLLSTGNGLKDVRGAMQSVGKGYPVGKTADALNQVMATIG